MADTTLGMEASPFSSEVNAQLDRLLETSWKSDMYMIVPKNAGQVILPDASEVIEQFWDPAGGEDVQAAIPFNLRFLGAARDGMQPDLVFDGLEMSGSRSYFQDSQRLWMTFWGTASGDEYGLTIDAKGDDPLISRVMAGEGPGDSWKLSVFLEKLKAQ